MATKHKTVHVASMGKLDELAAQGCYEVVAVAWSPERPDQPEAALLRKHEPTTFPLPTGDLQVVPTSLGRLADAAFARRVASSARGYADEIRRQAKQTPREVETILSAIAGELAELAEAAEAAAT